MLSRLLPCFKIRERVGEAALATKHQSSTTGRAIVRSMKPPLTFLQILSPFGVALALVAVCSRFQEPARRNLSAIILAGAGAAYLNGGLGVWEFAFCTLMTVIAYRGLSDYRLIGFGWLLHSICP